MRTVFWATILYQYQALNLINGSGSIFGWIQVHISLNYSRIGPCLSVLVRVCFPTSDFSLQDQIGQVSYQGDIFLFLLILQIVWPDVSLFYALISLQVKNKVKLLGFDTI